MVVQKIIKSPKARLVGSGATIVGSVLYGVMTGDVVLSGTLAVKSALDIFSDVAPEVFGGALQEAFIDNTPRDEIFVNGDLSRAIGEAIFLVIHEEAKEEKYQNFKSSIKEISEAKGEVWQDYLEPKLKTWNDYLDNELDNIDNLTQEEKGLYQALEEISPNQITQYITAKEGELDEVKSLTPQVWAKIVKGLYQEKKYQAGEDVCLGLGTRLYNDFAKSLRKTLIVDFESNGKAYASMQFRIVGEILYYTKENNKYAKENNKLNTQTLEVVNALSDKLNDICQNSPNVTLQKDSEHWEKMSQEFADFKETLNKTFQNTEVTKEDVKEVKADVKEVKETLLNQQQTKKSKPKGFINKPREPEEYFVEQNNIFERLDKHFEKYNTGYLHGTHGLGKTTTVIQYGYERLEEYEFILYILATDGSIENEMAKWADKYVEGLPEESKPKEKAKALKHWLEDEALWEKENKNWLIIFDNLESEEPITNNFPKSEKGDVLYTCNQNLYTNEDHELDFEKFTSEQSQRYVYNKVNKEKLQSYDDIPREELPALKELIDEIGNLPLTLSIASIYIRENYLSKHKHNNAYLRYLAYFKLEQSEVLKQVEKHGSYKDKEENRKLIDTLTAFSISIDKVITPKDETEKSKKIAELAEAFLNLISLLAAEDIPEELIKLSLFELVDTSELVTPDDDLFENVLSLLKEFDLAKEKIKLFRFKEKYLEPKKSEDGTEEFWGWKEEEINVFDTYRTLQNVLSVKSKKDKKNNYLEQLILAQNDLLPTVNFYTWEIVSKYLLHSSKLKEKARESAIYNAEIGRICNQIGSYLNEIGNYNLAEDFKLSAVAIFEKVFGKTHPSTGTSYNNLALLYQNQGKYELAEKYFLKDLAIVEKELGKNHPDTGTSYNNLALLYKAQGKYDEAENYYLKGLAIVEKELGKTHPSTGESYNNLAVLYQAQGKYDEAENYHLKALEIKEKELGKNHPSTGTSYNNLAVLYQDQGKYDEAENYYMKVIKVFEKELGKTHPSTGTSYNNLALLYQNQGKYELAEKYFLKDLAIVEKELGKNHPSTAMSYGNLGGLRYAEKKYQKALDLYEICLKIFEATLSENHPHIQTCKSWIAIIKDAMGE